jgi:hypothetical protein
MSDQFDGTQDFDPNTEIARDFDGCCGQGCASALMTVIFAAFMLLVTYCHVFSSTPPGTVITIHASAQGQTATANLFVVNSLPPVFVVAGRPFPGTRFSWVDSPSRQRMSGVELIGNLIGLNDGSIISDSCLPPALSPMPGNAPLPAPPAASTDILPIVPKVKSLGVGQ